MIRKSAVNAMHLVFFWILSMGATAGAAAEDSESKLATQARQSDALASSRGSTAVTDRISSDFSVFAGSTANADSLVTGLRNGTAITLTTTDANGATTSTTFTPPTGKMGYGNVFISLALAKQQLASLGVTQPTGEQLQAALAGGTITTGTGQTTQLTGILQMRSQGMGWGKIAQSLGFKLGPVISGIKAANAQVAARPALSAKSAPRSANVQGGASTRTETGIVTGSGSRGQAGASNVEHGNAYGRGIVTGTGGQIGASGIVGNGNVGQGNAYGRGIVTGTGVAGGQTGSGAAAQGKGVGKGN